MLVKHLLDVYNSEDEWIELYYNDKDSVEFKTSSKILLDCEDIQKLEVESIECINVDVLRVYIKQD